MAGFKLINEARDFVLHLNKKSETGTLGHVFAPVSNYQFVSRSIVCNIQFFQCAHNMACPRLTAEDGTPCNFISSYTPLPLDIENSNAHHKEMYSYVVLKKGPGNENDAWPRIVRPALVRSKHSICRMCTKNGKLEEVVFTQAKHGKLPYRCARSSKWGDRLPINIDPCTDI